MKTRTRVFLVLAMIAALVTTTASVSGAQEVPERNPEPPATASEVPDDLPDVEAPKVGDPVDDAELEDLTTFANQRGISVDRAVADYAWRFDFSLLAAEIRERSPEAYTYAEVVGDKSAQIYFSDGMPSEARVLIDNFERFFPDIPVVVQTDFGFNETEINSALTAAHFAVFDVTGDAASHFEHGTKQIRVTVPSTSGQNIANLTGRAESAVATMAERSVAGIDVRLSVSSFDSLDEDSLNTLHRGGEALSTCTSGFTFRHSGNSLTRGSTAGHCPNSQSDDGDSLTVNPGDYDGNWGDWQLHFGPDPEVDDFYAGTATVVEATNRDTSSASVPVPNQVLCKNGKVGLKDCDTVRDTSMCVEANCHLIEMDHSYNIDGDSGGPVFYSRTAYGGVEGTWKKYFWSTRRDTHSRQDSVHEIWYNY
ncbi:MAG: streptogrisin C [Verrucomicrobiales bacterium]|jgi:streptogrisin C